MCNSRIIVIFAALIHATNNSCFIKTSFLEMKVLKVKVVMTILEANGWIHVRTRGDHWIYRKEGEARPIPVPGNPNDDLAIGTLKSIFRQAGITDEDLKNY